MILQKYDFFGYANIGFLMQTIGLHYLYIDNQAYFLRQDEAWILFVNFL